MRNLRTEQLFDGFERGEGIFDDVVKKAHADGYRVHLHLGKQICDFKRVSEVGFAGRANLAFVLFGGKYVSATDQVEVIPGVVLLDTPENILKSNHPLII